MVPLAMFHIGSFVSRKKTHKFLDNCIKIVWHILVALPHSNNANNCKHGLKVDLTN